MAALSLFSNGQPRYIACYELKSRHTLDRYTVVFTRAHIWGGKTGQGKVFYLAMSERPYSPTGVAQHGEAERGSFCPGGSRIRFSELPDDCGELVRRVYADLWGDYLKIHYKGEKGMYKVRVKAWGTFYFADYQSACAFCAAAGIREKQIEVNEP